MARCEEFYEKWRQYPNWCEKAKSSVSQINAYLSMVDLLQREGVNPEFAYANFPEAAARPIMGIKNTEIKDKVIGRVSHALKTKKLYKDTMKKGDPEPSHMTMMDVKDIIHEYIQDTKTEKPLPKHPHYCIKFRIIDEHGEDTSDWVDVSYEDYEELVSKYGTIGSK